MTARLLSLNKHKRQLNLLMIPVKLGTLREGSERSVMLYPSASNSRRDPHFASCAWITPHSQRGPLPTEAACTKASSASQTCSDLKTSFYQQPTLSLLFLFVFVWCICWRSHTKGWVHPKLKFSHHRANDGKSWIRSVEAPDKTYRQPESTSVCCKRCFAEKAA